MWSKSMQLYWFNLLSHANWLSSMVLILFIAAMSLKSTFILPIPLLREPLLYVIRVLSTLNNFLKYQSYYFYVARNQEKVLCCKFGGLILQLPKMQSNPILFMDLLEWSVPSQNAELSVVTVTTIFWLLSYHLLFHGGHINLQRVLESKLFSERAFSWEMALELPENSVASFWASSLQLWWPNWMLLERMITVVVDCPQWDLPGKPLQPPAGLMLKFWSIMLTRCWEDSWRSASQWPLGDRCPRAQHSRQVACV